MKKIMSIVALIVAFIFGSITPVLAAWDIDVEVLNYTADTSIVKISLTSDAENTSFDLFSELTTDQKRIVRGKTIKSVTTDPDATLAPSAVYDITITNELSVVYSLLDCSTTATLNSDGLDITASGLLKIFESLIITVQTLGNGNKTVLYLEL